MNAHIRLLAALATLLATLVTSCGPCPPGGAPCLRIQVLSSTNQALTDARVDVLAEGGHVFGGYTRDGYYWVLGGCAGDFTVTVQHPLHQEFSRVYRATVNRNAACNPGPIQEIAVTLTAR